jgi:hypothetical protein
MIKIARLPNPVFAVANLAFSHQPQAKASLLTPQAKPYNDLRP